MAELTAGKRKVAAICGILLGIVFLVSGGWKVLSPFVTGELLEQAKVPSGYGVLGASTLGTLELFTAFLLFTPAFRRLGGLLGAGLMVFFIAWVASFYKVLAGAECNCFPFIKRTVGPGFFVSDGIFLLMALAAAAWAPSIRRFRIPAAAFTMLVALAAVSFGVQAKERKVAAQVPSPVIVDNRPADLTHGKVLLFFYDPSCMHCDAAAKFMSKLKWQDTKIVAIPTINPQWAGSFLHDTHLQAATSLELDKLKKAFPFVDPPYGVALVDGQVKERFGQAAFTPPAPQDDLKKLSFIE
jgi:hypothetical protein